MEKQRIVSAHNKVRQMVATGQIQGQPAATNMRQDKSLIIGIDPVLNIVAKIEDLYTLQGAGVGRGAGRGGAEVG